VLLFGFSRGAYTVRGHCQLICTRLNAACSAPVMRSSRVRSRSKDQRHRIGRGGTMWR
jgi:hypothetical protein